MSRSPHYLTISAIAKLCNVTTSALRFYEQRGLIYAVRTNGNQRRYHRSMIRRIAVIKIAQSLGMTLEQIASAFATLPEHRNPTKQDWERLSTQWRSDLDARIEQLQHLRNNLSGCIGCGCLSLEHCTLLIPDDESAARQF
ncbi:redox-sensitive transcriptional activator SoxR [Vibrio sp. SM6]|uniref:Redox-sensitive transcriptional activator SoxR n=1 Tax=Vibrio agarilyticus TaxID=2726741 RepID=A0A7X8YGQ0_9VIBR|nr:redox-sensitive transcriptional activator SoxR [Vibrio agarilyticus]NLS12894.1 redox-sensitive transcriptional activator SoxR [Vibrio agarilyticus]